MQKIVGYFQNVWLQFATTNENIFYVSRNFNFLQAFTRKSKICFKYNGVSHKISRQTCYNIFITKDLQTSRCGWKIQCLVLCYQNKMYSLIGVLWRAVKISWLVYSVRQIEQSRPQSAGQTSKSINKIESDGHSAAQYAHVQRNKTTQWRIETLQHDGTIIVFCHTFFYYTQVQVRLGLDTLGQYRPNKQVSRVRSQLKEKRRSLISIFYLSVKNTSTDFLF